MRAVVRVAARVGQMGGRQWTRGEGEAGVLGGACGWGCGCSRRDEKRGEMREEGRRERPGRRVGRRGRGRREFKIEEKGVAQFKPKFDNVADTFTVGP
ncbi:hypothetical protein PVK06_018594 [Gossypium arboreum]|uniref:Uncharacterized protein n=1 Tax=Gossypium arboreum TaxID=29729 RepID=A0ABR0PHE7_GOSAR|nr:hypothetical protein PVK06_018594 [Gossypium arboreum]